MDITCSQDKRIVSLLLKTFRCFQDELKTPPSVSKDLNVVINPLEKSVKIKQSCCFQFRSAYSLIQEPPKANWLIKSFIDKGSLMVLFGEPGCMKSFLAIDMGYCIATGQKWHGFPVRNSGPVFYIAGEGFSGLSKRLRALEIAKNIDLKDVPFFISDRPAQLLNPISTNEVIRAIEELKNQHGQPLLVIIDTLNRNFGPGDENKTEDMTNFVNCIDSTIRLTYGCAVLIVHHSPLNDSGRARGASSLRGALDWEYCLSKKGEVRKLSPTKVKDYEPPPEIYFKPQSIFLEGWIDEEDGDVMTSCVLEKVDREYTQKNDNKPKLTTSQKVAYDCLLKLCGNDCGNDSEGIHIDDWRNAAYEADISSSPKQDTKKKAFQRALDELRNQKLIQVHNDYWKPSGTRDIDGTNEGHVPD